MGLGSWDLQSDEAIYSYAVDRILETGDWLMPRSIPSDEPFLEKPPLKFWVVAGGIASGLLPHDEFGLRFFDALFGSIAFVYVFLLGRSLAGPLCGVVAVFVLFTVTPLLFEHGLRSNNMEAPLVLAFCGGVYHFSRWVEAPKRTGMHALGAAAYFVLGFMTKFVAALFLPIVCAAALAWRPHGQRMPGSRWRDWIAPAALVLGATVPWFAYAAAHSGTRLWNTMVAVHVYDRFTGFLDARHLQPWNYYFWRTWLELTLAGSHWIALIGLAVLTTQAWRGRTWLTRLLLVWWILPFALISLGRSKVFHYAYPFLPPIALGAGVVASASFHAIERRISTGLDRVAAVVGRVLPAAPFSRTPAWVRPILLVGALAAFALSGWTAADGPIRHAVGDVVLRNSSVGRPLIIGLILFYLSGCVRITLSRSVAMGIVAIALPVMAYRNDAGRLTVIDHPLRTLRDCAASLGSVRPETHVYATYHQLLSHSYYYYLRAIGPFVEIERPRVDELRSRIVDPSRDAFVVLFPSDYYSLLRSVPADASRPDSEDEIAGGLSFGQDVVILAPGPLERCAERAASAGGTALAGVPIGGTRG